MNFENYLIQQIAIHPSVQPQDIVKLCFQAAFGAEHLLSDLEAARKYFEKEYHVTEANNMPLYEIISDNVCRINLSAWKQKGFSPIWLFQMFIASASVERGNKGLFEEYLEIAEKTLKIQPISFDFDEWRKYLEQYKKSGMSSVHHSAKYRECESPSYRIVNSQYIRLFPILEKIKEQAKEDKVCVIAIDGRAASGKSTMAKQLKGILGADIIQIDDFFLPVSLRTQERFHTPGGNIHYERFIKEVLPYLSLPQKFSYRKFNCSKMDYDGENVIDNTSFRIVEGSYSCHPLFGDYADITVFSDINPDEQLTRIFCRNGKEMTEVFQNKWIPLEEEYFEKYKISQKVDIKL